MQLSVIPHGLAWESYLYLSREKPVVTSCLNQCTTQQLTGYSAKN